TARMPSAMTASRFSFNVNRSSIAVLKPFALPCSTSRALAARIFDCAARISSAIASRPAFFCAADSRANCREAARARRPKSRINVFRSDMPPLFYMSSPLATKRPPRQAISEKAKSDRYTRMILLQDCFANDMRFGYKGSAKLESGAPPSRRRLGPRYRAGVGEFTMKDDQSPGAMMKDWLGTTGRNVLSFLGWLYLARVSLLGLVLLFGLPLGAHGSLRALA